MAEMENRLSIEHEKHRVEISKAQQYAKELVYAEQEAMRRQDIEMRAQLRMAQEDVQRANNDKSETLEKAEQALEMLRRELESSRKDCDNFRAESQTATRRYNAVMEQNVELESRIHALKNATSGQETLLASKASLEEKLAEVVAQMVALSRASGL